MAPKPAKSKPKTGTPTEPWKQWPRTADLVEWMRTLLGLTPYMDDLKDRTATVVHIAIDYLAKLGEPLEALQWIDRLDKTVPPDQGSHHSQFVMRAAKIALDAGMMDVIEEYLQRMASMQPLFPRKCDQGYAEKRVRDFRAKHGLLATRDAVDDRQRAQAQFNAVVRAAGQALDNGDKRQARQMLAEAMPIIEQFEPWRQRYARFTLAEGFHRAGDKENLERLLKLDDIADDDRRFFPHNLLKLGQHDRAVARFQQEAKEALAEMETDTLNAHFPATQLQFAISGLADAGEMKLAREWLARALKEGAVWNINRIDAFSSAVFESMAKAVAKVEGPQAALGILDIAADRAQKAKPSGWRTAAIASVAKLRMELSPIEQAEAAARAVRSPKERTRLLVNLFAKRQEWDRLHETLNTAKTPIQAAELVFSLKFVWGAER
jgi:hypothetical protein